MKTLLLLLFFC